MSKPSSIVMDHSEITEEKRIKHPQDTDLEKNKALNGASIEIVDQFKTEEDDDAVSVESETNEYVLKQPPDGGRGWLVLLGCFCGLFCTQGYNYIFGVFLNYYNEHVFVGQLTALSWIGSLWLALMNVVGPFYSWFVYYIGYKWMLTTAVILWVLGLMLASIATQIWQLYLTQGVLMGLAASLVWFPCISAAQQWFSKKRGLSVGIAISGSGFGGLILSNILQAIFDSLGYQWALRIIGFISLVLLSVAALLVRPLNKPTKSDVRLLNLRPFRNFQFCLMFGIQFIGNFAFNVPSSFLPAYARYLGLDPWIGTNMSAIISGVMIVGKITSGLLSDFVGRANMTFIVIFMTGVLSLALWLPSTTAGGIWAFAALFGYFGGGYMAMVPALLGQVVGMDEIEAANGILFFAWIFGGLFGQPICAALINEESGHPTYNYAIIFGGVLMTFAGLLALAIRILRAGWNPFVKA
ncbi:major facilitator superfamily domain-containing protein [Mycotypha africana]|uniref:major facilitator superfamily domain-containing protein n=1 Tax=Mycotypha africana TaxID=64632 RepID=UPI002301EDE3|nr:major facilitator superfamily domain-containing protein [Mycotypha africana]KAI8967438.1 major facilitator superfamily domain-containing protein [Mycotypha africana]